MKRRSAIRTIGSVWATLALMLPLSANAASADVADAPADEAPPAVATLVVQDYTADGVLVDEFTTTQEAPEEGEIVPLAQGNGTIPAPSANSGCRKVWVEVKRSSFYTLRNYISFCYNKSTKKVSSASKEYRIIDHDGLSQITNYSNSSGYYTYHGSISRSGYLSKKTWHVIRDFGALGKYHYYPRADIYAHGNGTAYWSWEDD